HGIRFPRRPAAALEAVEIEGARAQRPLPSAPSGRRMAMVHLGGRPEEALASEFALVGPLGQVTVRLARGDALDTRKADPVAHRSILPLAGLGAAATAPSLPRRSIAPSRARVESPACGAFRARREGGPGREGRSAGRRTGRARQAIARR